MYVCSQTLGHDIASAHNYLYVEDSSLNSWSYSSSEIHSLLLWNVIVHSCIQENPPWDSVLQRLNPASVFTSFMHNIHVKIIISLWYLSWGIVTNIFCAFLIFSFVSFSYYCYSTNVPVSYFSYLPLVLSQQLSVSLYELISFLHMISMGPSYPI
jgi:hypothetical protein